MLEKENALKLAKDHIKGKCGLELEPKWAEYLDQSAIDTLVQFKLENGVELEVAREIPHWIIYFESKQFFTKASDELVVCVDPSIFTLHIYNNGEIKSSENA